MEKKEQSLWKRPKETIGSITVRLLEGLFVAMDGMVKHNIDRSQAYGAIQKAMPGYSKSDSARAIENLRRRGYIAKSIDKHGNLSVRFTVKAKMKIVDKITANMKISKSFHFLSFDIPEHLHARRDKFRRLIKQIGFIQIQQSLWVSNKNVGELVEELAYECGVGEYAVYIVSAMSNIDGLIDNKFRNVVK